MKGSSLNFYIPPGGWDVSSFPTAVTAPFGRTPRRRPKALWKVQPSLEGGGSNRWSIWWVRWMVGWKKGGQVFIRKKPGGEVKCHVLFVFWGWDYCTYFSTWNISEFFLGRLKNSSTWKYRRRKKAFFFSKGSLNRTFFLGGGSNFAGNLGGFAWRSNALFGLVSYKDPSLNKDEKRCKGCFSPCFC